MAAAKRLLAGLVIAAATLLTGACTGGDEPAETPIEERPRPIAMRESLWLEELTWMEIRDLIREGFTTIIVPTGGIEQNGPHVVTGKHNVVVAAMSAAVARRLGNALIAPVVKFVPEGDHNPPSGHMLYPGTISLSEGTFRNLLYEIAVSLEIHGFRHIVLLGDSGDNQEGLEAVARKLNRRWKSSDSLALYVGDYYFRDRWSYEYLKTRGIEQLPDVQSAQRGEVHSDYHYESILASIDPALIRAEERADAGEVSINGVSLEPMDETRGIGRSLIDYRAEFTAEWISDRIASIGSDGR